MAPLPSERPPVRLNYRAVRLTPRGHPWRATAALAVVLGPAVLVIVAVLMIAAWWH